MSQPIQRGAEMKSYEWGLGFTAQKERRGHDACPFPSKVDAITSRKRQDWFAGYYDSEFSERFDDWMAL